MIEYDKTRALLQVRLLDTYRRPSTAPHVGQFGQQQAARGQTRLSAQNQTPAFGFLHKYPLADVSLTSVFV